MAIRAPDGANKILHSNVQVKQWSMMMQDNAVQATPQLLFVALKYIVNENKLTLKLKLIDFRRRPYKSD